MEGNYLIFLSDDLLLQPKNQVMYTIVHETGHVILKHKNSILERQTKAEIANQEKEADKFAHYYLNQ